MKELALIPTHYHPIQSLLDVKQTGVSYQEQNPSPALQNYIHCFWELKTLKKLNSDFYYRVIADGCIDFFFNRNNPDQSFAMGFCKTATSFPLGKAFDFVGIRFYPSVIPSIFGINAKELTETSYELSQVVPAMASFIQQNFSPYHSFSQISGRLDNFLIKQMVDQKFTFDPRFLEALNLIVKNSGNIEIERQLKTGLSPRQLRRLFNFYIGTNPKTFSRVVRFQHLLHSNLSNPTDHLPTSFYDFGYFDQAHFIKDFKAFYGITPKAVFP